MFRNYLIVAYRNLVRHKAYSAINILGLAIGIAFCALTYLYVHYEWTYDAFHNHADRIYRVNIEVPGPERKGYSLPHVPTALRDELLRTVTDVDRAVRLTAGRGSDREDREIQVAYGEQVLKLPFLIVDPGFLRMFSFPLRAGDPDVALKNPHSVVLSTETATRIFGNEDPVGKQLTLRSLWSHDLAEFTVTGVAEPVPDNSSIQFEMLLPYQHLWFLLHLESDDWERIARCDTYIQLSQDAEVTDIESGLRSIAKANMLRLKISEDKLQLRLQPLTDLRHRVDLVEFRNHGVKPPRDPMTGYGLVCLSALVLVMASINYVNLAVGRMVTRTKESGIRKVVGALRFQLLWQYLSESLLMSILAVGLGLVFAEHALPFFNGFTHESLSIDPIFSRTALVFLVILTLGVGILICSYPGLILSAAHPVHILTGRFNPSNRNLLGRVLVLGQFAVSSALVVCTLIMAFQLRFVREKDLGFNKESVISINADGLPERPGGRRVLKDRYVQHRTVIGCTTVRYGLLDEWYDSGEGRGEQGQSVDLRPYFVDFDFVKTLEMKVVSGRDLDSGTNDMAQGSALANEELVRQMGWDDPIGQTVTFQGSIAGLLSNSDGVARIVGVVRDFHLTPLQQSVQPAVLLLNPSIGYEAEEIFVRVGPRDVDETLKFLEAEWKKIAPSGEPFYFTFLDEDIENYYQDFVSWSNVIGFSTVFAVFIACLGAFGLTALAVARRTKEIGIRKTMGATVLNIVSLLSREFALLVLIANLCAWPVAYVAMHRWLQNFAYRIEITAGGFLLGGLLTLLVVIGTVSIQTTRAARANPVEALRYE
ncbi:MAG: ABC transporter permease [Candidatus Latescibacteria bacterium]|nr:ABC transporter permease [Candidatus Latescibacterota bacterium]